VLILVFELSGREYPAVGAFLLMESLKLDMVLPPLMSSVLGWGLGVGDGRGNCGFWVGEGKLPGFTQT
jgi:hypothetical protein